MLNGYVNQALRDGSGPVTVIGYSAGGVVAWLWDADFRAAGKVRRFITLGSPLHGANLAVLGEAFVPGECPPRASSSCRAAPCSPRCRTPRPGGPRGCRVDH